MIFTNIFQLVELRLYTCSVNVLPNICGIINKINRHNLKTKKSFVRKLLDNFIKNRELNKKNFVDTLKYWIPNYSLQ